MTPPLLEARDIVCGYAAGLPVVHGVSARVDAGEMVALIGPNGAGKSTFLKALMNLVPVSSGGVALAGRDITGLPAHERVAAGLAFVPQTGNIFATLTVRENLAVGAHGVRGRLATRIDRAFAAFPDLASKSRQRAGVLSGGQRQMLAIARALMTDPKVILLDEPTAGLAPRLVAGVLADLAALARTGLGVLMVEQNVRAALRASDRVYVLAQGRGRLEGGAAAFLAGGSLAEAFLGTPAGVAAAP